MLLARRAHRTNRDADATGVLATVLAALECVEADRALVAEGVFAFLRVEFWLKALVAAGMALGAWFILSRPSAPPVKAADPE